MTELLDVRPGGVDLFYRPGDEMPMTIVGPPGFWSGRTFTATLGSAPLAVNVVGDTMSVTASPAQTAAAAPSEVWELVDTTAANDRTILTGRWGASDEPTHGFAETVTVIDGTAQVTVTLQGMTSVGDLTVAGTLTVAHPLVFWQHPVAQTIASGTTGAPIAFNNRVNTVGPGWTDYVAASTTIAVGSNGAALPQGTINVASTAGFATAATNELRYLVIRIGGTDRVVAYSGQTATQFTGCTFGVGTMTTGDAVAQANVEFNIPSSPTVQVGPLVAELAWSSHASGGRWTRIKSINGFSPGVHLNGGTGFCPGFASTDPLIRSVACEQPSSLTGTRRYRIDGIQTSGVDLTCPVDQLAAPRLVIQALSAVV